MDQIEPRALAPGEYLGTDAIIEASHTDVISIASTIRAQHSSDADYARATFEWVRDEIAHALDEQDPRVTTTATEVLREGVGLCFAKSHLLVALLRAEGVPAGLCYQRLFDGHDYVLHGLVAVYLDGAWHRLDARGNKPGVNAGFSLEVEQLAFIPDEAIDELDYPTVYVAAIPSVIKALSEADNTMDLCNGKLPTHLERTQKSECGADLVSGG